MCRVPEGSELASTECPAGHSLHDSPPSGSSSGSVWFWLLAAAATCRSACMTVTTTSNFTTANLIAPRC